MKNNNKKQSVVSEDISVLKNTVKSEVNFLILPYFSLDKNPDAHRKIEYRDVQQRGNESFEIVWTVIPHPEFGLPRDFDRRLQRAVEFSISSMPRPISNPVPVPGFRELARIMGVAGTGKFVAKVKRGFIAMMMTGIMSKRSYYNKSKKAWIEEGFHLYDKIVFKGETLLDGQIADHNYAYFTNGYLDNLNSMYVRPIDFEYLKSLRPIPSRLYELLGVKFYGHEDHILYKYSSLCRLLPLHRQKSLSRSRQQLNPAHEDLKKTGFIGRYKWLPVPGVKNDWYVKYVPGKRFFCEINSLKNELMGDGIPEKTITGEGAVSDSGQNLCMEEAHQPHNPASNSAWAQFVKIVSGFSEFDLRGLDKEWFEKRVIGNNSFECLDITDELNGWGDWLEIQHRLKAKGENSRFPKSNFRGSLINWLKKSLVINAKEMCDERVPRDGGKEQGKGWDRPTNYRVDVM